MDGDNYIAEKPSEKSFKIRISVGKSMHQPWLNGIVKYYAIK